LKYLKVGCSVLDAKSMYVGLQTEK